MTAMAATWHGDQAETDALLVALAHDCACVMDPGSGERTYTCPPHRMLVEDQRALNGLLFARRIRDRLLAEEQRRTDP